MLPDPGAVYDVEVRIAERAGCDAAPVDPTSDEGRLGLASSVRGDHVERFARLRGALAIAARDGRPPVERAGAADWLAARLAEGRPGGSVTVVWHSVVRQYVDADEWARVESLLDRPGVVHLSFEPEQRAVDTTFSLRASEEGGEVHLADGGGHGPPVRIR